MTPRTRVRRLMLVAGASTILMAAGASPAAAAPKGEYAAFADCPLSDAELTGCLVARTKSGEITLGRKGVPITNEITLQGGVITREAEEEGGEASYTFVGAADGRTLSRSPQKVPGGLAGLVNCPEIQNFFERASCEVLFENGLTGVNATTELAGAIHINETALAEEKGTALELPVKVRLENPLLGNECYIGSNAAPVVFKLTTGTTSPPPPNKPIKGKLGTISLRGGNGIIVIANNTLVDNAFSAPAATGCGGIFSFLLDPLIDAKLGIPASAGHNTAILNGTLEQTSAEEARRHE